MLLKSLYIRFRTQSEALRWLIKTRQKLKNPPQHEVIALSFFQGATKYLEDCEARYQKNTWRKKAFVYRSFLSSIDKKAFRMARIATGSNEDALDIVQEAMLAFVKKYASKPERDWQPLFYRVLQNRIRDWYRRQSVRNRWRSWLGFPNSEEGSDQGDPLAKVADEKAFDPYRELENQESMVVIERALHKLPVRQQQAFLLRVWEGMSIIETAAAMECSAGTVKSHYARAVTSLREELEGHWP